VDLYSTKTAKYPNVFYALREKNVRRMSKASRVVAT